ncbi:MAG: LON peptidase substrate-binding domain-containing protein [Hyphomicrobiales bacterium]|nr:LON peptidase substrate-binding domain-containing protein [Hyphomicrobiales bacterium]MCP5370498.1 LON peptidase substrate-binding domain-containing protein [Hyphomicrobiales bacterium]
MSDDLPAEIPVFPLNGVLLLPGGVLPLNIFEPRYLNMVSDALGRGRVLGMVQPAEPDPDRESPEGQVPVYDTGCLGRITAFSETPDGRFLITLTGINRFTIRDELDMAGGYRRFRVSYDGFAGDRHDTADGIDRDALLAAVRKYFDFSSISTDWKAIEKSDNATLITSLSMMCPFDAREKQALLECADGTARGELLTQLMEMAVLGGTTVGPLGRH